MLHIYKEQDAEKSWFIWIIDGTEFELALSAYVEMLVHLISSLMDMNPTLR